MSKRPVVVGLTLCEKVVVEEGTRNLTLVNCFSRRVVDQIPSRPLSFLAVVTMADGMGMMPLELRIERVQDVEEIYRGSTTLEFKDPLLELRPRLRIRDVSFPATGVYDVVVLIEHEVVAQCRLSIQLEDEA